MLNVEQLQQRPDWQAAVQQLRTLTFADINNSLPPLSPKQQQNMMQQHRDRMLEAVRALATLVMAAATGAAGGAVGLLGGPIGVAAGAAAGISLGMLYLALSTAVGQDIQAGIVNALGFNPIGRLGPRMLQQEADRMGVRLLIGDGHGREPGRLSSECNVTTVLQGVAKHLPNELNAIAGISHRTRRVGQQRVWADDSIEKFAKAVTDAVVASVAGGLSKNDVLIAVSDALVSVVKEIKDREQHSSSQRISEHGAIRTDTGLPPAQQRVGAINIDVLVEYSSTKGCCDKTIEIEAKVETWSVMFTNEKALREALDILGW